MAMESEASGSKRIKECKQQWAYLTWGTPSVKIQLNFPKIIDSSDSPYSESARLLWLWWLFKFAIASGCPWRLGGSEWNYATAL